MGALGALLAVILPYVPPLIAAIKGAFEHVKPPAPPATPPAPVVAPAPIIPVPTPAPSPLQIDLGAAKMDVLMQQVRALISKLVAINAPLPDGTLPATIPVTDDALRGFLEGVYQNWKADGGASAPAPVATQWYLMQAVTAPVALPIPGAKP